MAYPIDGHQIHICSVVVFFVFVDAHLLVLRNRGTTLCCPTFDRGYPGFRSSHNVLNISNCKRLRVLSEVFFFRGSLHCRLFEAVKGTIRVFVESGLRGSGGESFDNAWAALISCCFVGLNALFMGGWGGGILFGGLSEEVVDVGDTIKGVRLSNSSKFANINANKPL